MVTIATPPLGFIVCAVAVAQARAQGQDHGWVVSERASERRVRDALRRLGRPGSWSGRQVRMAGDANSTVTLAERRLVDSLPPGGS